MKHMIRRLALGLVGLVMLGGLLACRQTNTDGLPTPIPTAFLPTSEPTMVPPSPSATGAAALVAPTVEPTWTSTPVFATRESAGGAAAINITTPTENLTLLTGATIHVSGLGQVSADQSLVVQLLSVGGYLLAEELATVENNTFQVDVTIPITMTGMAQLQAQVRSIAGDILAIDTLSVMIGADAAANPRYLQLYHPTVNMKAVGGYYLFFDGYASQPTGTVQIALYMDNCQTEAAATSFRVSSSSYWQGYLYIPTTLTGPACAIARFGAPGAENWREAQIPLELKKPNEEGAYAVYLFSPLPQSELVGGTNGTFWGMAYNAAENTVGISLLREDGVNLAQGSATVDAFGYWETSLNIPLTYSGNAQVVVAIGDPEEENIAQAVIAVLILPPPTPTPFP